MPTHAGGVNRLERNHIRQVMRLRDAGGGLYTLRSQPGAALRRNQRRDSRFGGTGRNRLDEGSRSIDAWGNVVDPVGRALNPNETVRAGVSPWFDHKNTFQPDPGNK